MNILSKKKASGNPSDNLSGGVERGRVEMFVQTIISIVLTAVQHIQAQNCV